MVSIGCGASAGKDPAGSDRNLIIPLESKIERCVFVQCFVSDVSMPCMNSH